MKKLFAICMTAVLCLQMGPVPSAAQTISGEQTEDISEEKETLGNDELQGCMDESETSRAAADTETGADAVTAADSEENNIEETRDIPEQQNDSSVTVVSDDMQYDDRISVKDLLQETADETGVSWENYITYSLTITEQSPSSLQVNGGRVTGEADTSVLDVLKDDGSISESTTGITVSELINNQGRLHAAGTGTAVVCLTAPDGSNTVYVNVTVSPAELTLMFVSGQSNAEGWCSANTGYQREYSIAAEEGTVYSTYVPSSNLSVANSITGLSFSGSCTSSNADDYVPGALAGESQDTSISGEKLEYKGNTLTTVGSGKTGMDSGLAYEWQKLTGDKVWVVNASWGGSSIISWVPGRTLYERAETVYDLVYQTYCAEIKAGHYIAGDQLMFWLQGEQDKNMEISAYGEYFEEMYEGLMEDFSYLDGIGVVTVRSSVGSYVDEDELQMTAPRVIQYAAGNNRSYEKLYVVSNANEQWVSDGGVQSYFQSRYGERIDDDDYPIRTPVVTPVSMSQIHSDIHYSQLGHNENGVTAAEGLYSALHAGELGITLQDVDWYGNSGQVLTEYEGLNQKDTVLIPVANPVYTGKQMNITASKTAAAYNSNLGIIPQGETAEGDLVVSLGSYVISRLSVNVSEYLDFTDIAGAEYTGFYYYENDESWYYVENGKVYINKTDIVQGTVNGEDGWWYVKNGKVAFEDTVAQNSNGWWRVEDGKVNLEFNGFAENKNGWWYIIGGKVAFETTDILQGTVNGTTGWWYVKEGKVTFTDTVAQNHNGWWYISNGRVDFDHYGVEQNSNGWWKIEAGKVNFDFKGFAENQNGWWYLSGGKVQFDVTDVIQGTVDSETGWWYVKEGKVTFTDTVAQNSNGWWRIEAGRVNFNFGGFAENSNGWWYLSGGKVQFGTTDVIQGTVNGTGGWWYVSGGKVTFTETVAQNSNGWWYIKDGMVDFSHYGVEKNSNGWWRIEAGKVNFAFYGIAENKNGWWYISGGKVDFSYNGTVTQNGVTYTVIDGAVQR